MKSIHVPLKASSRLSRHDLSCIENALNFIDKWYPERISSEQLSFETGLSKKKLHAGIRCRTGLSLHEYILKVRIEKSKHLLIHTSLPLKAIAGSTGFKTCSHFCKVFKTITYTTPTEYRFEQVQAPI